MNITKNKDKSNEDFVDVDKMPTKLVANLLALDFDGRGCSSLASNDKSNHKDEEELFLEVLSINALDFTKINNTWYIDGFASNMEFTINVATSITWKCS